MRVCVRACVRVCVCACVCVCGWVGGMGWVGEVHTNKQTNVLFPQVLQMLSVPSTRKARGAKFDMQAILLMALRNITV